MCSTAPATNDEELQTESAATNETANITESPTDEDISTTPVFYDDDEPDVRHLSIPEDVPDEPENIALEEDLEIPHLPMPDEEIDDSDLPTITPRIIGGTNARLGEFKGSISVQTRVGRFHFCGGTIIDAYHVLTAAHCLADDDRVVRSPNDVRIYSEFKQKIKINKNSHVSG